MCGAGNTVKTHATDWEQVGPQAWERTDEWGNHWRRLDAHSKGEVVRGVLEKLDDMDSYEFPDFSNVDDYEPMAATRREHPELYLLGGMPGFAFNIARKLRRLDQYMLDLLTEPDRISALHDRIDDLVADMIRNYAAQGADAVMFCEDWGTQQQLFIDPELWRREFYPRFERLCGIAHQEGLAVWMHSCGAIGAIVPDLMRAGIDAFQFDQPELHGLDTLAAYQEQAPVTFWSPVDTQRILPTGDIELVREHARLMLDKLWKGRGGFVAGIYGDNNALGIGPEVQQAACETFDAYGRAECYANQQSV